MQSGYVKVFTCSHFILFQVRSVFAPCPQNPQFWFSGLKLQNHVCAISDVMVPLQLDVDFKTMKLFEYREYEDERRTGKDLETVPSNRGGLPALA
jgi:hypothetical protein